MKFSRPTLSLKDMATSSKMDMQTSSLIGAVLDHQASLVKDLESQAKHHLVSLAKDPVSLVRDQAEVGVTVVVNTKGLRGKSMSYREEEEEDT